MDNLRNRFIRLSVLFLGGTFLVLLPLSRVAAAGLSVGGAANMAVLLGRTKAVRLAGGSVSSIKWSLNVWGLIRWPVYAAVFYIGYKLGGGRATGLLGAAAGLIIPLAVMVYTGATDLDAEKAAD